MGTRSLTFVYDEYGEPIVNMYRQYDGYPTGQGAELAEFLLSGRLVNGLSGISHTLQFNGMSCLAASMIAHFKKGGGGIYLYPITSKDCSQEYIYHVYEDKVVINDTEQDIFTGTWQQFKEYCSKEEKDFEDARNSYTAFDTQSGKDWLKSVLSDNVVTITFTKNDGTERVMKCTLDRKLVPEKVHEKKRITEQVRVTSLDALPVYDVEAQSWRSFRWDSIKTVTVSLV